MNKYTEKGSFISKQEAIMLQAVAVMLMVWHHLFGFPDRITEPFVLILDAIYPVETYLAYFGRVCISIFAFSSGYGLRKKHLITANGIGILQNYQSMFTRLLKFFSRYWAVFFVFVPIGFALRLYSFNWKSFLGGIIGNGSGYNGEWWYVGYYVRYLLLFPLLNVWMEFLGRISRIAPHVFTAACVILLTIVPSSMSMYSFLTVLICFWEGMYFVDSKIFECVFNHLPKKEWNRSGLGIGLFCVAFLMRHTGIPDYWLVAPLVFAVMLLLKANNSNRFLHPPLIFIGQYSTYIWLTHTFFAYYFFQKLTFLPQYSWLIFIWCLALCVLSAMVLENVLLYICKLKKKYAPTKH